MELLLNLLWLVIAVGSVVIWRGMWRRGKAPSRFEWVALATMLFLLFPVISLTDDLHEEVVVVECATGTKHFLTSAGRAGSHQNVHQFSGAHPAAIRGRGFSAPAFEGVLPVLQDVFAKVTPPVEFATGRAPPQIHA